MTMGMLVGIDDTLTECSSVSFVCMTVMAGWRHVGGGSMTSLWRRHDFYITCLFTVIFGMMGQYVFRMTPPHRGAAASEPMLLPACSCCYRYRVYRARPNARIT